MWSFRATLKAGHQNNNKKVLDFSSFHSHYSVLTEPLLTHSYNTQSDNSHDISNMPHTYSHTHFISVADGLKLLSCLRWEGRNLISYYTHTHTHTHTHTVYMLTHTELDVKAFGLVEPFIWSFYGSGPGSLNAQSGSQDPLSQNTVQLSFQTNNI